MTFKSAFLYLFFSSFLSLQLSGQVVFEPHKNTVYAFLDEMAAGGHIRINTFSKPFARNFIAAQLDSLNGKRAELNQRQSDQLDFFLKDYGKELQTGRNWDRRRDLVYRSDSTFSVTINPILGGSVMANENGTRIHRRLGAEFFATAEKFGFYGSLRDNNVTEVIAAPQYLTPLEGQNYKTISAENRSDYNEAIGGISYQWNWGDIALLKDRFVWGNTNRHANIFSGKAPSYAAVQYRLYPVKWLDFQYMHGWLVSEVLDSSRTYLAPNGNRRVQTNKNIAANYLTIKTKWNIDFTAGNSIIYSDQGIQPVYFIPFLFYKSADHTYSGTGSNELGQNAQMFFDLSVRSLRKVHLHASLFVDEVSFGNMWDDAQHTNIMSVKIGGTWYNALPNLNLSAEYTRTNPWTYRHQVPSTTFASNQYNLGHYLGENADEIYLSASYRPLKNLMMKASMWQARKGQEHVYEIILGNANVTGLEFMSDTDWKQSGLRLDVDWEMINGAVIFIAGSYQSTTGNELYLPEFLSGNILNFEMGFRIGW